MVKILCACGCGRELEEKDRWGRKRKYLRGHGGKSTRFKKGQVSLMKGRHHTDETKQKMSNAKKKMSDETKRKIGEAGKGRIPWNKGKPFLAGNKHPLYGKHLSEETKRKISQKNKGKRRSPNTEFKKGHTSPNKGLKLTEEQVEKMREMRKHQKFPKHHTMPELIFEEICKEHNLPFHYVGDSSLWIGEGKVLNPDFIEANGKKVCVEIFGDYWHSPLLNTSLRENATLPYKKKHYKRYGWKAIFIWESDLKREDAELFVLTLLKKEGAI